ncbi:MAG: winged helix-turn-helix domain-containing protein [Phycisphaerae bacterium]
MKKTTKKSTKSKKSKAAGKPATKKPKAKKADGEQKPKRVSALDAAAQILAKAEKPMRAQELIGAMAEQGLWSSPAGKTPHATLYAAMLREVGTKGDAARFKKVDRGLFAFNANAEA